MSCSFVVARYKEDGNMGGEYKKNVFKGSFTKGLCDKLDDLIKDVPSDDSGGSDTSDSKAGNTEKGKGNFSGTAFDLNGLKAHNILRDIHGSKDMKIDSNLSQDAQLYAKKLAQLGYLKHAQLKDIGENLAYGCSSAENYELSAAETTKRW